MTAVLVFVAACGGSKAPPAADDAPVPEPPADAITKESAQGAAVVTLTVWPEKPTLGDSIWLRLEAKTEDGVTVELPFDQIALGRFQVLRFVDEPGRVTYELAAPMSGKHRIPPLRAIVHDFRSGTGTGTSTEVLTEEIPIEVGTVLAEKTDAQLAPAKGAIDTHVGAKPLWQYLAIGLVPVGIALAAVLWIALRQRAVRHARISAWEMAMQRLADLERRGAPAPDEADAWFVELSSVVRAYVEGRYRLRAPELTTEEFLTEARRIPELGEAHRDRLGSFLERCDRVKFAGWRPQSSESLEVHGSARTFVVESRPQEVAR
jgi:hypothetical protein